MNSVYRAIRFGRALRSRGRLVRADQTPLIPKRLTVLSDSVFHRLGTIRNTMEHIENDVIKETAVATVTSKVNADSIELGGEEIWYSELAQWMRPSRDLPQLG